MGWRVGRGVIREGRGRNGRLRGWVGRESEVESRPENGKGG